MADGSSELGRRCFELRATVDEVLLPPTVLISLELERRAGRAVEAIEKRLLESNRAVKIRGQRQAVFVAHTICIA